MPEADGARQESRGDVPPVRSRVTAPGQLRDSLNSMNRGDSLPGICKGYGSQYLVEHQRIRGGRMVSRESGPGYLLVPMPRIDR